MQRIFHGLYALCALVVLAGVLPAQDFDDLGMVDPHLVGEIARRGMDHVTIAPAPTDRVEPKTFYAVNKDELKNALGQAQGGDTIYLGAGVWEGGLGFSKMCYPDGKPLTIRGAGATVLRGDLSIMDCHNLVCRDLEITGPNIIAGVNLNDSYPEIGIKNIALINLNIHHAGARGIFHGGHHTEGLYILGCTVRNTIDGTHGVYISGGHFDAAWPPIRHVVISGGSSGVNPGGRCDVQFNGRFEDVLLEDYTLYNAELSGVTLIGVHDAVVRNVTAYGSGRSAIVIYDYASHWGAYFNYFESAEDIEAFNQTHWPNQNILVERCTFVVGPTAWHNDAYHHEDPTKNHPAILENNAVHSGFLMWNPNKKEHVQHPGWNYPMKNLVFKDNVLHGPSPNLVDLYHDQEARETSLIGNLCFTTSTKPLCLGGSQKVKLLQGNVVMDPKFKRPPKYPFVDRTKTPDYDWNLFKTSFDAFSWPAHKLGKGRMLKPGGFWVKGEP